jgi:hypothetical protein
MTRAHVGRSTGRPTQGRHSAGVKLWRATHRFRRVRVGGRGRDEAVRRASGPWRSHR